MKRNMGVIVQFGRTDDFPDGIRVPMGLGTAVSDAEEIKFNTLCEEHETQIKQQNFCEECDHTVETTVSGYPVATNQWVVFTKEELDAAKPPRNPLIEIRKFVPVGDMSPLMRVKHYFLIPDQIATDGYGILYQGLMETDTAGIGSESLYGKEHPCAIYPFDGVLVLSVLSLAENMREPDFDAPIPAADMKELAKGVIRANTGRLDEKDLSSKSKEQMLALIRARLEGRELPAVEKSDVKTTVDLMASLKAAVAAAERAKKPVRKPRARAK